MAIAAVTGLAAEARIARANGIAAIATGGAAARAEAAAQQFLAEGRDLVSFGIAGALAPTLAPGTLLLPRRVLAAAGAAILVDAAWHARIRARLGALGLAAVEDDIIGLGHIVAQPDEKAALYRRTGAVAVDLESHVAAAAAARFGRKFLVLRAVADPAGQALPPAAAIGLDERGRAALLPVLGSILRRPGQIGGLIGLAWHTRAALRTLRRAARILEGGGSDG